MNNAFSTKPNVLSDVVRNIVIGRAMAGSYDAHETTRQAIAACHAAARQKLGQKRLSPAQASEVDALVTATRQGAFQNMDPALRGRVPETMMQQLHASEASGAVATQSAVESETSKAILAALVRLEQLIKMIVTLVFHRALAGKSGDDMAALAALSAGDGSDAIPDTWRGNALLAGASSSLPALPAAPSGAIVVRDLRNGSVQTAQLAVRASAVRDTAVRASAVRASAVRDPAPRRETQLASWNGSEMVVYGEDVS